MVASTDILKSPSGGLENIVNVWIYEERAWEIWEQWHSQRQWSRTEAWTNEEKGRFPTSIQIRRSSYICDSDSDQFKKRQGWDGNANVEDGTVGVNLLPRRPGGRHKNGKNGENNLCSFTLKKEPQWCFQGGSLTGNSDSDVSDGECKQHTAPRASFTCHSRNVSRRVHVAQGCWLLVCVFS